ncbi:MAG: HAD-IA family hydrolase [Deltaproteobacteria bacterium]|nr:HAD-IA family hydrolase [Deltaproteobacteria bacterium]
MDRNVISDQIQVVIFDCDGVMFDSRQANIAFYNAILNHFEKPCLGDDDTEIVHMSTAEESINYLFRNDPQHSEAQKYRFQVDYKQFINLMAMEPHLEKVLKSLRNRYQLALATNRSNTIQTILDMFKLSKYFDYVVSSLDVNNPKPHPESIFKILNHFSIDAHESVYVGDSIVDYEVTRQANIFFIAYKHPQLKADYHINDLRELLTLLSL